MEYIEVSIEITPFSDEHAEIVTAEISELGFESYLTEEPYLKAYIPREQFHEPHLKTVLSLIPQDGFTVRYSLSLIPEQNWNALWESSFEPVVIDGRCTIKASFHKGLPRTKYTIVIDPKMAFGTGHHQTTTLIIKTMLAHEKDIRGLQVLDMGCGTGIPHPGRQIRPDPGQYQPQHHPRGPLHLRPGHEARSAADNQRVL